MNLEVEKKSRRAMERLQCSRNSFASFHFWLSRSLSSASSALSERPRKRRQETQTRANEREKRDERRGSSERFERDSSDGKQVASDGLWFLFSCFFFFQKLSLTLFFSLSLFSSSLSLPSPWTTIKKMQVCCCSDDDDDDDVNWCVF